MNNLKYELNLKGMKCSNCANKVETKLRDFPGVTTANVNLITDKALITVKNEDVLNDAKEMLDKMGFVVSNVNDMNRSEIKSRVMKFEFIGDFPENKSVIESIEGVIKVDLINVGEEDSSNQAKIEYDPEIIKGHNLHKKISEKIPSLKKSYLNNFTDTINNFSKFSYSLSNRSLLILIIISILIMSLTMLNTKIHTFLKSLQIFTPKLNVYLFTVMGLSLFIIYRHGLDMYKRSYNLYKNFRLVNMETLISLSSISSLIYTMIMLFRLFTTTNNIDMWMKMTVHAVEAPSIVIAIAIIGKYIEERAKKNIKKYTTKMFDKLSLNEGRELTWIKPRNRNFVILEQKSVDVGLLEKDDFVKLEENALLLFDGVIVHGEVEIKENITFGYDAISSRKKGDKVKSGSIIKTGDCVMMVEEVLEQAMLFKIIEEMNSSLNQKLKFQHFLDKIMNYFVPAIICISILTFVIWFLFYLIKIILNTVDEKESKYYEYLTFSFVVERAISILVISCPCAFGLAIPTVTTIVLNLALKQGMLVKNLSALPEVRKADYFVFDKTGTLTEVVREAKVEYLNLSGLNSEFPIFDIVAQIEKNQKHPIGEVIYSHCLRNASFEGKTASNFSICSSPEIKSNGLESKINYNGLEYSIHIGNPSYMRSHQIKLEERDDIKNVYSHCVSQKLNVCFVAVNEEVKLVMSIDSSSNLRKEAKDVMTMLTTYLQRNAGILSGDQNEGVKAVGRILGLEEGNCIGEADNRMKKEVLNELKKKHIVLMIGDGVNDILSLSEADYGISFNANSQLNLVASDIIFVKEDLRLVLSLLKLSKFTYIFIWINIFWACIYNLLMLPIAAGAFYSVWSIEMSPTSSSLSMLCSSLLILITSNSIRLFNFDYSHFTIPEQTVNIELTNRKKSESNILMTVLKSETSRSLELV